MTRVTYAKFMQQRNCDSKGIELSFSLSEIISQTRLKTSIRENYLYTFISGWKESSANTCAQFGDFLGSPVTESVQPLIRLRFIWCWVGNRSSSSRNCSPILGPGISLKGSNFLHFSFGASSMMMVYGSKIKASHLPVFISPGIKWRFESFMNGRSKTESRGINSPWVERNCLLNPTIGAIVQRFPNLLEFASWIHVPIRLIMVHLYQPSLGLSSWSDIRKNCQTEFIYVSNNFTVIASWMSTVLWVQFEAAAAQMGWTLSH